MWYKDIQQFKMANGYEIDGIWYPRVTSIVSIKAKPGLYSFYAGLKSVQEGDAIKEKSAEEGTLIHNTIESILRKEPVNIPDAIKPAMTAFFDFYSRHEINPLKIEERIISCNHGYSGTLDVLADIDGTLGVLDIKTSGSIYRDYNIQTSAYVEALQEDNKLPSLSRWILRIDQNQKCLKCSATLRTKGGNAKVRNTNGRCEHEWSPMQGEWELKELADFPTDIKAFLACKSLWEWEHQYWLSKVK